jgi:hypothetical protein
MCMSIIGSFRRDCCAFVRFKHIASSRSASDGFSMVGSSKVYRLGESNALPKDDSELTFLTSLRSTRRYPRFGTSAVLTLTFPGVSNHEFIN